MDSMQNITSIFNSLTINDPSKSDLKTVSLNSDISPLKSDLKTVSLNSDISPLKSDLKTVSLNSDISPPKNDVKELSITKTLYFSGDIIDSIKLFEEPSVKEQFTLFLNVNPDVKINNDLHITLLYTGGKPNPNSHLFDDLIGTNFTILVDSFAVSDKYITFKVLSFQDNIPYFGNKFMHLTYLYTRNSKPVESPSAFLKGSIFTFDKPIILNGIISKITK